jgi:hypothetical protein
MTGDYPGISAVASFIDSALEAAQTQKCRKSEGRASNTSTIKGDISLTSKGSLSSYTPCPLRVLTIRSNASRNIGGESNGGSSGYMPFFTDLPGDRDDPHLPCHLMPLARNKGFFGRKEILEDLENALLPANGDGYYGIGPAALKSFAICGPGGMKPAPLH